MSIVTQKREKEAEHYNLNCHATIILQNKNQFYHIILFESSYLFTESVKISLQLNRKRK